MKIQSSLEKLQALSLVIVMMVAYASAINLPSAHAVNTPFTKSFVRYDSLKAGQTNTTGRVCFQPTIATAIHSIELTFPTNSATDYVVSSTATNWTFNTSNLDTGQTAVANLPTNPTVSGKTLTITLSSDLTPTITNLYCFNWGGTGLTLPTGLTESVPGNLVTKTSGAAIINQTNYSYSSAIITNNQVVVNATVPPSFTFVLSGNTDSFASNLSTSSVNTSTGNTITITTNAPSGWIVWAQDTNFKTTGITDGASSPANRHGALTSATASGYAIANLSSNTLGTAAHVFSSGAEDYGLQIHKQTDAAGGGLVTIDPAFIDTTVNHAGVPDQTMFRPVASANGTANGDVLTMKELVTIAGQTPAASDYTDTISYVGAGQF